MGRCVCDVGTLLAHSVTVCDVASATSRMSVGTVRCDDDHTHITSHTTGLQPSVSATPPPSQGIPAEYRSDVHETFTCSKLLKLGPTGNPNRQHFHCFYRLSRWLWCVYTHSLMRVRRGSYDVYNRNYGRLRPAVDVTCGPLRWEVAVRWHHLIRW